MSAEGAGSGLGHPRLHLRQTDSTNVQARRLAAAGAPHGTLVTADEQQAGRGRQGRTWSAPPGSSLLMSLVLSPPPALTPLIAAVAVCDLLAAAGTEAAIKWPNDIVIPRADGLAKLAGILVEGRPQEGWAVLGIGLNVAVEVSLLPEDVAGRAATLGLERSAVEPLLAGLLRTLQLRLAESAETVLEAWRGRDALLGRRVIWGPAHPAHPTDPADPADPQRPPSVAAGQGVAEGIDGEGRLVVRLERGGQIALQAGEVHLGDPPASGR